MFFFSFPYKWNASPSGCYTKFKWNIFFFCFIFFMFIYRQLCRLCGLCSQLFISFYFIFFSSAVPSTLLSRRKKRMRTKRNKNISIETWKSLKEFNFDDKTHDKALCASVFIASKDNKKRKLFSKLFFFLHQLEQFKRNENFSIFILLFFFNFQNEKWR